MPNKLFFLLWTFLSYFVILVLLIEYRGGLGIFILQIQKIWNKCPPLILFCPTLLISYITFKDQYASCQYIWAPFLTWTWAPGNLIKQESWGALQDACRCSGSRGWGSSSGPGIPKKLTSGSREESLSLGQPARENFSGSSENNTYKGKPGGRER